MSKVDRFPLRQIATDHPVGADLFVPLTIARLAGDSGATQVHLTVELRDVQQAGNSTRELEIHWPPESAPSQPLAIDQRSLTESAACGIACVVVSVYAGLRFREVTADGDRFDFWVTDGQNEYGLEVSGTTTGQLKSRHAVTVRQLLDNPFGVDGYVVVVDFATRRVIFSFHQCEKQDNE
jgi:hypothetical protein